MKRLRRYKKITPFKRAYIETDLYEAVKRLAEHSRMSPDRWIEQAIKARMDSPRFRVVTGWTLTKIWSTAVREALRLSPEDLLIYRTTFFLHNFGIRIVGNNGAAKPWDDRWLGVFPPEPIEDGRLYLREDYEEGYLEKWKPTVEQPKEETPDSFFSLI